MRETELGPDFWPDVRNQTFVDRRAPAARCTVLAESLSTKPVASDVAPEEVGARPPFAA